eukprot:9255724-Heterocapsa_arctica.AAC.1
MGLSPEVSEPVTATRVPTPTFAPFCPMIRVIRLLVVLLLSTKTVIVFDTAEVLADIEMILSHNGVIATSAVMPF